ncbi:hypothetical protein Selin_2503 [Desulfurispirillum indicum S5]|uniref:MazG nucleotide pyrophosphohydrolase n=1 Tax=Desulfurispirillum indicum (strain ATCC BAA-1389 / DSM 22839 / S5) TaxID=653733 RepID=E6W5T1_DESIS|nr:nucleotide pyrophosphohydrolase [Desulfurispirillum indicum]ADU67216.1 hypothetical protein Selin_2503 [Desulfurispirillum indicum S5]
MQHLKESIRQFCRERDWEQFHSPKNLAMGLSVEAAELLEIFQWLSEEQSRNLSPEQRQRVSEEVGDVLIFLVNLCDKLGLDPQACAMEKLQASAAKYPAELVKGSARKYTEY